MFSPVVQRGQGFASLRVQSNLRPRVAIQFEDEAFALARYRRRFHHATTQDDHFAAACLDYRRGSGSVHAQIEHPCEEHAEQAADTRQHARSTP